MILDYYQMEIKNLLKGSVEERGLRRKNKKEEKRDERAIQEAAKVIYQDGEREESD
ncbi:unnamed protein product [Larinioides sclopetarius]|uniref:Uncharacterized protein n=1 Tax=Larinioides sclopetarius TaxID=280406 RepID=A0AAV1ZLT3_9ARAC